MARKVLTDLNLSQNEIQNAVEQNLASAPSNPKQGQKYFDTTDKKLKIFDGTSWVDCTSQGKTYEFDTDDFNVTQDNKVSINENNIVKASQKGAANGVATLDSNSKVPLEQLPSYVDDVVDLLAISATAPASCVTGDKYFNSESKKVFTATGTNTWGTVGQDPEKDKIYVNLSDNKTYRWSGTTMVEISPSPGQASPTQAGIMKLYDEEGQNTDGTMTQETITNLMVGLARKIVASNPALTPSGDIATWTISNTLGNDDVVVMVKEAATGNEVYTDVTVSGGNVVIKINASSSIAANTYKAVIIG